jgi:hypothetical protein
MITATRVPPAKVARVVERARHHVSRLHRRSAPAPVGMMELILGAWMSQAITVAAELDIADALAAQPLSADELAMRVNADPDGIRRLMRALISQGVFCRRRDGRYELNALAATLRSDASTSMAAMARFVGSTQHREHWTHLADAVRTGEAVVPRLRGKDAFDYLSGDPDISAIYNDAMTSVTELAVAPVVAAYDFSRFATIVDVGGGHGRLLAAILAATPRTKGILYDLPQVVAGAPKILRDLQLSGRARISAGSFFEDVPESADAYILKNVVHDWPDVDVVDILRNVRRAARPGSTVLLVEAVIPAHDREFLGKWSDLEMLVVQAARERTEPEYRALLEQAGLSPTRVVPTASPFSLVEARA